MITATTTATIAPIIAIDLSKYKRVSRRIIVP
jgi:hypothetical protein